MFKDCIPKLSLDSNKDGPAQTPFVSFFLSFFHCFSGQFFRILKIIIFCFVVDICDLVHDVDSIFHLPKLLTTSGNVF